jgi:DNA-binding beta-propeller fold protein YncE
MDDERFDYLEIGADAAQAPPRATPVGAPTLRAVQIIGGPGAELGQFNAPSGLAVDGHGNLYVADTNNHRVQLISPGGSVYGLGLPPGIEGPGRLHTPIDVAVDGLQSVYVLEHIPGRISKFDARGRFVGHLSAAGEQVGFLSAPRRMHRDDLGRIYVADTGNDRVQIFDSKGGFIDVLGGLAAPGNIPQPQAVAVGPDHSVWVADDGGERLLRFSSAGGRAGGLGGEGTPLGKLQGPLDVDITRDGLFIIVEHGSARLLILRPDGTPIATYRGSGHSARLDGPVGVAWSQADRAIYIADAVDHRVVKLQFGASPPSLADPASWPS